MSVAMLGGLGLIVFADNAAGTRVLELHASTTSLTANSWYHLLCSWDVSTSTGHLYLNDANDLNTATDVYVDSSLEHSLVDTWSVGANGSGAGAKWDGGLAEIYFAPGQYLDFSVEANRRKFITSDGKPANLGLTGSIPTGTAPIIYLHLDDGETASNLAVNRGTGGNLTVTGALTTRATSPSD